MLKGSECTWLFVETELIEGAKKYTPKSMKSFWVHATLLGLSLLMVLARMVSAFMIKSVAKPVISAGRTIRVHIGGLIRLDVLKSSAQTIYIIVWASSNVPLHLGKTENADELREKHFGIRLQPPIGPERVNELGHWTERCIEVSGASWDVNSMDIAVSGLGWYSLGLKGTATVSLWTF